MSEPYLAFCASLGPIWALIAFFFAAWNAYDHAKALDRHQGYFRATTNDLQRIVSRLSNLEDRVQAIEGIEISEGLESTSGVTTLGEYARLPQKN